jgi:magnesium-transporting ATPase (P-type)
MAVSASTDTESWYSRGLSQIYDSLDADSDGLSTEEAESRRSEHGPNRLPKAKSVTVWQIFLRQFKNPLIYILAIAAIVSFAIGEKTDAGFIALVLLINALVGGIQEWRAECSSQALQQLIRTRATSSSSNRAIGFLQTFVWSPRMVWKSTSRHSLANQHPF